MKPKWLSKAIREQRAFEAWLERREIILARRIGASRNRLVSAAARQYEVFPDTVLLAARRKHIEEVEALLKAQYRRVINEQSLLVVSRIRSMKRIPNYEGYFERLIMFWTRERALESAESIAATAIDDVRRAVAKGQKEGKGSREIARAIRAVALLTPSRALTIARTETHGAAMYASETISKQASNDFGLVLQKHWLPTIDARTRDAHAAMDSEKGVDLNGDFIVGGVRMSRPGDPRGGAANVINCRCGVFYGEVEDVIQ